MGATSHSVFKVIPEPTLPSRLIFQVINPDLSWGGAWGVKIVDKLTATGQEVATTLFKVNIE